MSEENKSTIHQTLDQTRARAAWKLVIEAMNKTDFRKYEILVKRFPALVNHNGLGQSCAFLLAAKKGKNAEGLLLVHLGRWLMKSTLNENDTCYEPPYDVEYISESPSQVDPLMECIMTRDSRAYIRATREALAFLDYLRRFADGLSEESISYD